MKITKTEETVIVKLYECSVCGKTDKVRYVIETCEKEHEIASCEHSFTYESALDYDCPDRFEIQRTCRKCPLWEKKYIESDSIPEEIVKALFESSE